MQAIFFHFKLNRNLPLIDSLINLSLFFFLRNSDWNGVPWGLYRAIQVLFLKMGNDYTDVFTL